MLIEQLRRAPLFRNLSVAELDNMAMTLGERHLAAGELLLK